MRGGDQIPAVNVGATLAEAVLEVSRKRMGMTAVVDDANRIVGVFTDGDLRRTLERIENFRAARIAGVMTTAPRTIGADALATEAVHMMESSGISQLLVSDDGVLVGALNMHDLFRSKVV
jgi:arabinose-5-phosphate isomerase